MRNAHRLRRPAITPLVRCAIYTRKSSEEGLEQNFNSLHAQREACEAYVLSQAGEGWSALPSVYDDGGYSGGNTDRPALARLLADVDAGKIDTVVVYKVDRLTRSLSDFARIVERFDAQGVSFVSVTQAFNTTNSMGRLTLNVLLSFAQFEREVTGERIRDKIAASKAKGMWMGGPVPLGYDSKDRTLVINLAEAEQVRGIFRRYLELQSVPALRDALAREGMRSKVHTTRKGLKLGGKPFGRSALFSLLSNRLYVGEIAYKGQIYPAQHEAIVGRALFEAVQAELRKTAHAPKPKTTEDQSSPFVGRIIDDRGNLMSPVTTWRRGRGYRYFVSTALLVGRKNEAGSVSRVPAHALETLIAHRLARLTQTLMIGRDLKDLVEQIEVSQQQVTVDLAINGSSALIRRAKLALPTADTVQIHAGRLRLVLAATIQARGGVKLALGPDGMPAVARPAQDPTLLQALIRAEAWKHCLLTEGACSLERLLKSEGAAPTYARRIIRIAFLSPALKRAILDGRAPPNLTVEHLKRGYLPLNWAEQEAIYPLPAASVEKHASSARP